MAVLHHVALTLANLSTQYRSRRASVFDDWVDIVNWAAILFVPTYTFSMFLFPFFKGDWKYVQEVWDRWQSLNAGMLAFVASVLAFNITRYSANRQREREFAAAKAFLPDALTELCIYFQKAAVILNKLWDKPTERIDDAYPAPPSNYREVFAECIKHAPSDAGNHLAKILVLLQIHEVKLSELIRRRNTGHIFQKRYLYDYYFRLGELRATIDVIFDFARSEAEFDSNPLSMRDLQVAYRSLWGQKSEYLWVDAQDNLVKFTEAALAAAWKNKPI